jgi:hypothetical protein
MPAPARTQRATRTTLSHPKRADRTPRLPSAPDYVRPVCFLASCLPPAGTRPLHSRARSRRLYTQDSPSSGTRGGTGTARETASTEGARWAARRQSWATAPCAARRCGTPQSAAGCRQGPRRRRLRTGRQFVACPRHPPVMTWEGGGAVMAQNKHTCKGCGGQSAACARKAACEQKPALCTQGFFSAGVWTTIAARRSAPKRWRRHTNHFKTSTGVRAQASTSIRHRQKAPTPTP